MKLSGGRVIALSTISVVVFVIMAGNYFLDLSVVHRNILGMLGSNNPVVATEVNPNEITIVTMYLNIGKFQKGGGDNYFTPDTYKNWMQTWGWLTNRVISFFDTDETLNIFRKIRSSQPEDRTVLIKLKRSDIPAFKNLEKIKQIYANATYPKHPPNTVYAEYSCAMNAKYDVIQMAISKGLVYTTYIAWLDIGLFRNLLDPKLRPAGDRFSLEVPDNFNSSSIGMTEVSSRNDVSNKSPWDYISQNNVWVSGAFSLGTKETLWEVSESYKFTVEDLLKQNMSSTDQQVIGAMYSPGYIKRQKVDIKGYTCSDGQFGLYSSDVAYFCLGYVCKDAAEKRRHANTSEISTAKNV